MIRPPVRTKERYILDSLVSIFKGGHWVEDSVESLVSPSQDETPKDGGGGVPGLENGSGDRIDPIPMGSRYVTVIGGQKYDKDELANWFFDRYGPSPDVEIVTGAGRGVEASITRAQRIELDPDRYGKSARKVNVEEVLCYAIDSPLLLVGNGERVKQARAWLERTKSRREVTEVP
jgi:hypothetical protein